MLIIQSKTIDLYQKLSIYIKNYRFILKKTIFIEKDLKFDEIPVIFD